MKVVCAGCGKHLGETPASNLPDDAVSHGFCEACAHNFMAQLGMPLDDYLEGIPAPVVTITPEVTIGTANARAREILGKDLPQIVGHTGGDVFECEHSLSPEGCGHTVHCNGCVIRNTVLNTLNTGKPHARVPATLNPHSNTTRAELLISTEKRGDVVFLRIEELKRG
jgi:hypothetical protein